MGLILEPPSFAHCSHNLTGTPSQTPGTNFTAGASGAYGTTVQLLAALSHDVHYLIINLAGIQVSTGDGSAVCDILLDRAGGTTWDTTNIPIPNLICGQSLQMNTTGAFAYTYHFPIFLPAGAAVALRAKTTHGSNITTGRCLVFAHGAQSEPANWWFGHRVEPIGVSGQVGTNHTAGNSGAYSSWTNFGSTLSAPCGALQFVVQGTNTDTTQNAAFYFYEFGIGSTRIGPPVYRLTNTTEQGYTVATGPVFRSLPAGTQFQVRGTCSGTAEALDVAGYAVI